MRSIALVVLLATSIAGAESFESLVGGYGREKGKPPVFAFTDKDFFAQPKSVEMAAEAFGTEEWMFVREIQGKASDKKTGWISADMVGFETACGAAPCPPEPPPGPALWHATALIEDGAPIVWHAAQVVDGKAQKAAIKKGTMPPAIPKKIDGAEDLVALFEGSIGDPKALAKTVSTRKEVVLYGNEAKERTVGGSKVAAKLKAWNLSFKVRDGIQAGLSSSKTMGWVAANLDATSKKKPKDKPVPYRALLLYEKAGTAWKLVSANFSYVD